MAEITHKSSRSVLASFQAVGGIGTVLSYLCGYLTNWRWLSAAMAVASLVAAASIAVLPETPHYLVSKDKIETAR